MKREKQKGFSFRDIQSDKLQEKKLSYEAYLQNVISEIISHRAEYRVSTILDYSKIENQLNSGLAGRFRKLECELAEYIFSCVVDSETWKNICWNDYAWKDGRRVNLDQQDLMLRCRKFAKELLRSI